MGPWQPKRTRPHLEHHRQPTLLGDSPLGGTDIQRIFNGLKKSPEFRLFFADRVHRHFFNRGALADERILTTYLQVSNRLNGVVSGFNNRIGTTWIPQRRKNVLQHFDRAGMLASSNAPAFSQHGGAVASGHRLAITNLAGTIYFTTNGSDPRIAFTGQVASDARAYQNPIPIAVSLHLRARSLNGTNWSALTEAAFSVNQLDLPLRFTEIMYHPPGGDAFEFLELSNLGELPLDLAGFTLEGVTFRFPSPGPPMPPGARWILANDARPADFTARYPDAPVVGWFGGSLDNGGERIDLRDPDGHLVTAVSYQDDPPWPTDADGAGASLEWSASEGDPNDPATWSDSTAIGGSPGQPNPAPSWSPIRLSELTPGGDSGTDWIEIENDGDSIADLGGCSLGDSQSAVRYHFPNDTRLAPGARLRLLLIGDAVPRIHPFEAPFRLDPNGETLVLHDPQGSRLDAVTFGYLPVGYSLGRLSGRPDWELCEPTPLAPNEKAQTAPATRLALNEWLPNPLPGADDWIELHNTDPLRPLPLKGLLFAVSNQWACLSVPSYAPASGFVILKADDQPGPNHLSLKLPASGSSIVLYDSVGGEVTRVTYAAVSEGISWGRIPDGSGTAIAFPGTASPGASNYLAAAAGPRINEWMSRNTSAIRRADGSVADWIELRNPTTTAFDLSGCTLDTDRDKPWTFPSGTRIAAGGYLVLWCDPTRPASTNNTPNLELGFGLAGEGGRLRLTQANGQLLDEVRFGSQIADRSVGIPFGSGVASLLSSPTPGAANAPAAELAVGGNVLLNEWKAGDPSSDDWIELHNRNLLPVDLGSWSISDDPSLAGIQRHLFPPLTLIAPTGFRHWIADGNPDRGANHLAFRLDSRGESLRLYDADRNLRDAVDYAPQTAGISVGRFPDGSNSFFAFPGSASPGSANWRPHPGLVINELLTHTDPPLEDAIELHNASASPVDLQGWYISDDAERLRKFAVPPSSVGPPDGFLTLFESLFNPAGHPDAFTLNSAHGGEIWLSETDSTGALTGRRVHAAFEAMANGVSLGRYHSSLGWTLVPQSRRTFGKDAPASVEEFRQSAGLPNAYPAVGPILLTELHFHPMPILATNPIDEFEFEFEFLELHNSDSRAVGLFDGHAPTNTWRIRGGVEFEFPPGTTLAADHFAVVLGFNPTNTARLAEFKSRYGSPTGVSYFGPFRGRLSDEGEIVRLERPDTPQAPPNPDAGFVPWLLVEAVDYRTLPPWPDAGLNPGASLQRWHSAQFANDPANWVLNPPSPGSGTVPPTTDRDFDGLPNDWETTHGMNPEVPTDAALDADGDGLTNFAEFLAGTDPRDPSSRLQIRLEEFPSVGLAVRFEAVAQRTYSVLQRGDAERGLWSKVADVPADYFDRTIVLPLEPRADRPQFFRVITPAQP